jgi:hypothetical protein
VINVNASGQMSAIRLVVETLRRLPPEVQRGLHELGTQVVVFDPTRIEGTTICTDGPVSRFIVLQAPGGEIASAFPIAHEYAHAWLDHKEGTPANELAANELAAQWLAATPESAAP